MADDTSAEMQERQYAIFRAMTPEARMHLAFELSDMLRRVASMELRQLKQASGGP
jgi:hypothetical protein